MLKILFSEAISFSHYSGRSILTAAAFLPSISISHYAGRSILTARCGQILFRHLSIVGDRNGASISISFSEHSGRSKLKAAFHAHFHISHAPDRTNRGVMLSIITDQFERDCRKYYPWSTWHFSKSACHFGNKLCWYIRLCTVIVHICGTLCVQMVLIDMIISDVKKLC